MTEPLSTTIRRIQAEAADASQSAAAYVTFLIENPKHTHCMALSDFARLWQDRAAEGYRRIVSFREDYDRRDASDAIARRRCEFVEA